MTDGYFEVIDARLDKEVKLKHGDFLQYNMTVRPPEGIDVDVQLLQKPETRAPEAGDRIFGRIEDTDYGYKFKKSKPEDHGYTSTSPSAPRSNSPGNDERGVSIERQSMVKAACELLAGKTDNPYTVLALADAFVTYVQTGSIDKPSKDVDPDSIPSHIGAN